MLNLTRLKVLTEVLGRGSFSAAADALGYTQSAVSQAIARLEAETGATLVVRDRRGVRPTAAGAALLEHAESILVQVQAAEDELAAVLGVRAGRLRAASFPSAGTALMPQAIATFTRRHPGIQLSLTEGEPEEIVPRLRGGELDLALLYEFPGVDEAKPPVGTASSLAVTPLIEDPMLVALPAEHQLASKLELALWDLRGEDWVQTAASSPCARHVVRSCLASGFEPHVTFESDDYETIQGLVAAGVGVALIPRLALTRLDPGIVVRSLAPASPTRGVVAATPAGPGLAPAADVMLEILSGIAPDYAETRGWAAPR